MDEKLQALMGELGAMVAESGSSVLPMLVPKPAEVSCADVSYWQPEAYPVSTVLVTASIAEGSEGSAHLLIPATIVSALVDLMLGGEGATDREMNEEATNALKEAANQLLGVMAQSVRERYDGPFSFSQVEVHSLDPGIDLNLLLGDEAVYRVDLSLKIDGQSVGNFVWCMPAETITSFQQSATGTSGEEVSAPETQTVKAAPEIRAEEPQVLITPTVGPAPEGQHGDVGLVLDIELPVTVRLGTTEMTLQEILRLGSGAMIELSKSVDEPVELMVNNKIIAFGEVVVVEGNFAFRVTEIVSKTDRIQSLA